MLNVLRTLLRYLFCRLLCGPATETDLIALRHQVLSLQRQLKMRPKLTPWDRLLFAELYKVNPLSVRSILIVKPDTVVRWHRAGFRLFWRMQSRQGPGRPKIPAETRALIREMSKANVLWRAPRVHGESLKLGVDVSQSTVAKYMVERVGPPSQAWTAFLKNHADGIAAIDLSVVPTLGLKLLCGLVVLDHGRRRILHVAATHHPTSAWIARQIVEAFPWEEGPEYTLRNRDASYGSSYRRRLQGMRIRDRPVAPQSPW